MTDSALGPELRKYRALAWTLVVTLFVSVALFIQFMMLDRRQSELAFSASAEQATTISGMRMVQVVERLEVIGREYLLLGASDKQVLDVVLAFGIDDVLISLCARRKGVERVLYAATDIPSIASAGCQQSHTQSQVVDPGADDFQVAIDLQMYPSTPGDGPTVAVLMRTRGADELIASLDLRKLLGFLVEDAGVPNRDSQTVCLSVRVDEEFQSLACDGSEVVMPESQVFMAMDAQVARQVEVAGHVWRVDITPHLQLLASPVSMLPVIMFGAALFIGGIACIFTYQTTDKNIRLEAHADELQARWEQLGQLEQQNSLLDQFAAMAAHDLQAPIRFIVSNAHLLAGELDEQDQPELSRIAEKQVEHGMRMRDLVVDLLEFCRAGQSQLNLATVDVLELVREEVGLLKAHEEYADTDIVVGSLPTALVCDPDKLSHIVRNLVGNAVKFSQDSPDPKVSISASRETLHGSWTFRVSDNGPGIDKEHHESIFRPFSRLDPATKGTGMGLAIVKIMLERHGGTIHIDPDDTLGSTFCFTLPGALPTGTLS